MKSRLHPVFSFRWPAAAAVAAAMLTACGGGTSSSPEEAQMPPAAEGALASFMQQTLEWRACDRLFLGDKLWDEGGAVFEQLGARAQCALMRAPIDYADPESGELLVALSRVAAGQPQRRMGAIVFNPGGPGADGLAFAARYAWQWSQAGPANPALQQLKQMSDRYDFIGFSPRGMGAGTLLGCNASASLPADSYSFYDRSPQNLQSLQETTRLVVQGCTDNPLSQHIHTDATARDMDLMRVLLGEDKLNYIGYSYGTWLGTWYASLFPERVGRMLIDSITNVLDDFAGILRLQEMGKQRLLDEIVFPYAARRPQVFNLGQSPAQLRSELVALSPRLKHLLFSEGSGNSGSAPIKWNRPADIDNNLYYFNAALGLQTLLAREPAADKARMHEAIDAHRFATDPAVNAKVVNFAHELADRFFAKTGSAPMRLLPQSAVNVSVRCNDTRNSGDAQYWIAVGNESAARYPLTGGALTGNPCIDWPWSGVQRPPLARVGSAGPLLMVQSRYDALTPMEGAQATWNALPNASMIVVENEFMHGVFPYFRECVDAQVVNYFLNGRLPPRLSSCAGSALQ